MVQEVNDNNVHGIISENEICCIKLWADWCEPCKQVAPKYEELSDAVPSNVMMCSMAVDENPDFPDEMNLRSIPTIMVFKKGECIERYTGTDSVDKLRTFIQNL